MIPANFQEQAGRAVRREWPPETAAAAAISSKSEPGERTGDIAAGVAGETRRWQDGAVVGAATARSGRSRQQRADLDRFRLWAANPAPASGRREYRADDDSTRSASDSFQSAVRSQKWWTERSRRSGCQSRIRFGRLISQRSSPSKSTRRSMRKTPRKLAYSSSLRRRKGAIRWVVFADATMRPARERLKWPQTSETREGVEGRQAGPVRRRRDRPWVPCLDRERHPGQPVSEDTSQASGLPAAPRRGSAYW
jgi:hypothetical protein